MSRNDKRIPRQVEKLIYQQAGSRCAFCAESAVALLEIHHIVPRAEGGPNDPVNLILACRNCHRRIESGEISRKEVLRTKRSLGAALHVMPRRESGGHVNNLNVTAPVSSSILANHVTIGGDAKLPSRIAHPSGSIGADVMKKNYVDYLIRRYYDFRKSDVSYGASRPFNHGVIHSNIASKFKAKTFFIPEGRFDELVVYLQGRIDQTVQGRVNRKRGRRSYSSFEQYVHDQGTNRGTEGR